MTGAETLGELPGMIEEVLALWIEGEYEDGHWIPLPTQMDLEFSGKFNLRLPKSLHRDLARAAEREGVSLNQHVLALLARGEAEARTSKPAAAPPISPRHRVAEERAPYRATPATRPRRTTTSAAKPRRAPRPAKRTSKR
jgi:hypothetical protein